jgi:ubiquitin carboxyl-terminal hydrolase 22/27/51
MDLSLDVKNIKKRKLDAPADETQLDLRSCLERFTSREKLGSEDYTCQSCKERQSATKQLSIKQLPPVLSIHLKRFEHTNSTSSKIETKINFPIKLDLYPFTTFHKSTQTKNAKAPGSPPNSNYNINNPGNSLMYELAGVIVHKGKIDSGHYVNYTRDHGEWFMFDDSKVVLVSEADVLAAQAYILFYIATSVDV